LDSGQSKLDLGAFTCSLNIGSTQRTSNSPEMADGMDDDRVFSLGVSFILVAPVGIWVVIPGGFSGSNFIRAC